MKYSIGELLALPLVALIGIPAVATRGSWHATLDAESLLRERREREEADRLDEVDAERWEAAGLPVTRRDAY
jgi:hypothetical protein